MNAHTWQLKYNPEQMERMRHQCDPLADAVAARLQRARPSQMLDQVMVRARSEKGVYQDYLDHCHTVPAWVNWDAIEQGRRVSLAFANVRALALLVSSLVEGYSLSKAAHVLVATGRLRQDVVKRLNETGQMTHNMHQKDGIKPGGLGHRTIMEVRLLHAMVRKFLRQRDWDVGRYDEPINQEDMAFTIIEFDHLAYRGMEKMGAQLSREDREALHHLWRYAAYLNGVDDFFQTGSPEEAAYQYQVIKQRQRNPNEESKQLARAVLGAVGGQPPFYFPAEFLYELSRLCLGDELADAYELPRHAGWRAAIAGYRRTTQAATLAHYRIPGAKRFSERLNFHLGAKMLQSGLEENANRRAFRHVAEKLA